VIAAHHVAHDLGALAVLRVGGQILLPHRVEDAALNRLESVAHIGQRARCDDGQRVVEIAALGSLVQRHALGGTAARRRGAARITRVWQIEQRRSRFSGLGQRRDPN